MRTGHRWIVPCGLLVCVGCAPKETRLQLTTFDAAGRAQQHYADFRRSSYHLSAGGTLELVLRSERPSSIDPTQTITQIVYLKTFWTPRPGTTYAESSQTNARVQYAMLTPPTGVRYDGGAFISYKLDQRTGVLTGRIESGTLSPRFRMGSAVEPFGPARFTGVFCAADNPRDVVNAIQWLDSQFSQRINTSAPVP